MSDDGTGSRVETANILFERAIRHLGQYFMDFEDTDLALATQHLRAATRLDPSPLLPWIALGWVLDAADKPHEALAALDRAAQVDPTDEEVSVYRVTLRAELGPENEALADVTALAARLDTDLEALRSELRAADMPLDSVTLVRNAFLHARNYVRSRLSDEVDRVERKSDPAKWYVDEERAKEECFDAQERLAGAVASGRVPTALQELVAWASRIGVGDFDCRQFLLAQLGREERDALEATIARLAGEAHSWLDSFADRPLPEEAAAVMFLLLGVEESRSQEGS